MADLSTVFTGIRFPNPFLLASAPPTESESNILRAYEAGWGGVVTKTIGLHQVVNVRGPRTTFLRSDDGGGRLSMARRPASTVVASWNWELISDKPLDWWVGRLSSIKRAFPDRVLVASVMAGSGSDEEMRNWQTLVQAVQDEGVDAVELNFSCPHMDRIDMGSNVGKDKVLCSTTTQVVKEVARVPVWVKLTPATADIVEEATATFLGGADAIVSSNTFPSLPPIDPDTLDFEVNVEGLVSSGGLGGPAILMQSLAKMAQLTQAFPDREFCGRGRHLGLAGRALLLPARLRHRAGGHGGHARPCHRPQRHPRADRGHERVPRPACRAGLALAGRLPRLSTGRRRAPCADRPAGRGAASRGGRGRRGRRGALGSLRATRNALERGRLRSSGRALGGYAEAAALQAARPGRCTDVHAEAHPGHGGC